MEVKNKLDNESSKIVGIKDVENTLLITINKACELTGIGRNTMLKLTKIKGFPAIIMPHKILIDKSELHSWIKHNYGKLYN